MSRDDQQDLEDQVSLALLRNARAHLEDLGDAFPASLVARAIEIVEYREHDAGFGQRMPFGPFATVLIARWRVGCGNDQVDADYRHGRQSIGMERGMSPADIDPKAIEEREALKLLEIARELLERTGDYTAIMFLDYAITTLRPGGDPITIRPI